MKTPSVIGASMLMLAVLLASASSKASDSDQAAPSSRSAASPTQSAAPSAPPARTPKHARRDSTSSRLDERVRAMTRALDLDPAQQAQLQKLLEEQRDEVRRIWNDASIAASDRIGATQAASKRTADRIRAMLNDEQRNKYNPPPPQRPPTPDGPTVEQWMNLGKPH